MLGDLSVDIEILKTQLAGLMLLIAASGVKEYDADWLDDGKTVTRDSGGRFAKGDSHSEEAEDIFHDDVNSKTDTTPSADVSELMDTAKDIADNIKVPKMDNVDPKDAKDFVLGTTAFTLNALEDGNDKALTTLVDSAFGKKALKLSNEIRSALEINAEYNNLEPGTKVKLDDKTTISKTTDKLGPYNQIDVKALTDLARTKDPDLAEELPKAAVQAMKQWDEGVKELHKFADEGAKDFEGLGKSIESEIAQIEEWVADAGSSFDACLKDAETSINEALFTAVANFDDMVSQIEDSWVGIDARAAKAWIGTAEDSVKDWASTEKKKISISLSDAHDASEQWVAQQSKSLSEHLATVEGTVQSWAESVESGAVSSLATGGQAISAWTTNAEKEMHKSINSVKQKFNSWAEDGHSKKPDQLRASFKSWAKDTSSGLHNDVSSHRESFEVTSHRSKETMDDMFKSLKFNSESSTNTRHGDSSFKIPGLDNIIVSSVGLAALTVGAVATGAALANPQLANVNVGVGYKGIGLKVGLGRKNVASKQTNSGQDEQELEKIPKENKPAEAKKETTQSIPNRMIGAIQSVFRKSNKSAPSTTVAGHLMKNEAEPIITKNDMKAYRKLVEDQAESVLDSLKTQFSDSAFKPTNDPGELYEMMMKDMAKLDIFMPIAYAAPIPELKELKQTAKKEVIDMTKKYTNAFLSLYKDRSGADKVIVDATMKATNAFIDMFEDQSTEDD